jgi:serine protease Do
MPLYLAKHTGCWLIAGMLALPPIPALAQDAPDGKPGDIIWCHDTARSITARKARWRCKGEVVSEERAKSIRDRRRLRINRSFAPRKAPAPGVKQKGTGSGFYVTDTGHVVTNHHVVDRCKAISVTPASGGAAVKAHLIAADPALDLALLRSVIPGKDFARFRGRALLSGDEIAVVGYPLHGKVAIKPVLVRGHVSVGRGAPRSHMFAMKIDVRRGNSGGPILDAAGRIVGVVVAKVNTPGVYASTGKVIVNLGFGIRQPVVLDFLKKHKIATTTAPPRKPLDDKSLMAQTTAFVAQIGCWR